MPKIGRSMPELFLDGGPDEGDPREEYLGGTEEL
jgi:hypothetical protein